MKKLVLFVAVIATMSFASCGNKSAESTEAVAETETVVDEAVVEEADSAVVEEVAVADSTAVQEVTPAN